MADAKRIAKKLKRKNITFENIEKVIKQLGYSIILFNTDLGDIEIERYNLKSKKTSSKGFTYSKWAHIVFIDANLHPRDKIYVLLHELGHICLGHIGDGKSNTRDKILMDIEADSFAYSIIKSNKKHLPYAIIASIVLSISIALSGYLMYAKQFAEPVYTETLTTQSEADTHLVYVTQSGRKFHLKTCFYVKNKNLTELTYTQALNNYTPCAVCEP